MSIERELERCERELDIVTARNDELCARVKELKDALKEAIAYSEDGWDDGTPAAHIAIERLHKVLEKG